MCKDLISYSINKKVCTGCEVCKINCPSNAIIGEPKEPHSINYQSCVKCELCFSLCPYNAIFKTTNLVKEA